MAAFLARAANYEGLSGPGLARAMAQDVRRWAPDGTVYFVGSETELPNVAGAFFDRRDFEVLARLDLPTPPPQDARTATGRGGRQGVGNRQPQPDQPDGLPGMAGQGPPGMMGGPPPRGASLGMGGGGRFRRGGQGPGMGGMQYQGEKQLIIARWRPPGPGA